MNKKNLVKTSKILSFDESTGTGTVREKKSVRNFRLNEASPILISSEDENGVRPQLGDSFGYTCSRIPKIGEEIVFYDHAEWGWAYKDTWEKTKEYISKLPKWRLMESHIKGCSFVVWEGFVPKIKCVLDRSTMENVRWFDNVMGITNMSDILGDGNDDHSRWWERREINETEWKKCPPPMI